MGDEAKSEHRNSPFKFILNQWILEGDGRLVLTIVAGD